MKTLDVQFLPQRPAGDVAVVIDVLRMTTTATQLFKLGLARLWVVAGIAEARALAKKESSLLLGERQNKALPGFDGGNSPLEYQGAGVHGKGAVLSTSNGAGAVEFAANARHLLLGAVVNAGAVAKYALERAQKDISLICAGTGSSVSFDDVLGAACIASELLKLDPSLELSDGTTVALKALEATPSLSQGLKESKHGLALAKSGFAQDIAFAAKLNSLEVVAERAAMNPAQFRRVAL